MQEETLKKILNMLGASEEEASIEYSRLHQRLSRFFEWNGVADPTALADEAIDRLGNRGTEEDSGEPIVNPSAFALGIARLLLHEEARRQQKKMRAIESMQTKGPDLTSQAEAMDRALQHCLATLPAEKRNLLKRYYIHSGREKAKSHQQLAAELGLTINALRNRALRARQELELRMREILKRGLA